MRQLVDRLSIRSKILLGNALLLGLFVLALVVVLGFMGRVAESTRHLRDEVVPTISLLADIDSTASRLLQETENHASLGLITDLGGGEATAGVLADEEGAQMLAMRQRLTALMAALDSVPLPAIAETGIDGHRLARDLRARLDDQVVLLLEASVRVEQSAGRLGAPALFADFEALEEIEAAFAATIDAAKQAAMEEARELQALIERRTAAAIWLSTAILVVGAATVAVGSFYVARRIAQPVQALRDAAARLGAGDLDARPGPLGGDEIGELGGAFTRMADDLKAAMERQARQSRLAALGELAGTVNHELRNPLTTISNSMHSLRRIVPGDPEPTRLLDRIERNVDRCVEIVGDFLDFARPPTATRAPTELDAWIAGVLDEYELPRSVTLERQLAAPVSVALDAERFRRVLVNLLDNAVQAMTQGDWQPPPGAPRRITVRSAATADGVVLSVADTGPGVAPENLGRVFEPLFTTKSFGLGLGLAAARRIVGQHGGSIEADGSLDRGVCFTIRLPLGRDGLRGAA